jgi:eukaryotic-like serine/threonine-protein kinase
VGAVYQFGPFRLDAGKRLLTREGRHLTLPPKTFDLLVLLVESRGRVFAKKELMAALWHDAFVEDANLSFQISALRKVLGGEGSEWIETLPRYGYRFAGNVIEVDPNLPSKNGVGAHPEPVAAASRTPSAIGRNRTLFYYWLPTAIVTIIAGYLAVVHLREKPLEERAVSFLISPPDRIFTPDLDSIAVSPNGDRLLFVGVGPDGGKQLWMRALGSLTADAIAGTELVDAAFWSPDGRSLAFFAAGKLKRLDLQGGSPQMICHTPVARSSGSWSRDGVILFETTERPEIYSVAASGGEPKPVTRLNASNHETRHYAPQFLPDGRHFIYFVQSEGPENTGIYIGSLDSQGGKRLTNSDANAVYTRVATGANYLLFPRGTNLMGQAFDVNKRELVGTPFVVAQRLLISLGGGLPGAAVSASGNGVLAYRTRMETGSTDLVWFDRTGKRLGSVSESAEYSNPALSPDEKKLVVSRVDPQTRTRDLWLFDFSSGASSRFTFDPADETNAVWSQDGKRIAFNAAHNGAINIYEKEIAGTSEPKLLLHSSENKYIHGWSPDGKLLLFRIGPITWALPSPGGGKILGPYAMENPRISPNGRWVAYTSNQSGRSEVYVQNFLPSEGKWQISAMGGTEPAWRADGKELFFINADKLFAMQVKTDSLVFEPGVAKPLFSVRLETAVRRSRYQVAGNGQRFLINVPLESPSPITVSTNWLPRPAH